MADNNEKVEYTLVQAVEYFSLTPVNKSIAKKLWKGSTKDTVRGWEIKFIKKGLIVKKK